MSAQFSLSKAYANLLNAVKTVLTQGLFAAQKMLDFARLKTYWQIGKEIIAAVKASGGELRLSDPLYQRISDDIYEQLKIEMSVDTVRRTVQFYNNYPVFPDGSPLTFGHYLALMRVKNLALRLKLERKAAAKDWSVPRLKEELAKTIPDEHVIELDKNNCLPVQRGEPFVYYVQQETGLKGKTHFRIDCGFKINLDFPLDNPYVPTHSGPLRSLKQNDKYSIQRYKKGWDKLYTYGATTTKVVDGDTIDARIDVGFGIRLSDRLRLRGINAPEADTPSGRKAKKFLEDYFSCRPLVILRTFKTEMYGRWLADIFSLERCDDPYTIAREGEYLNQILLDRGMAQLYR